MADRLAELRAGARLSHVEITIESSSDGPTKLQTPLLDGSADNDVNQARAAKAGLATFLPDIELAQNRIGDIKRAAREISEQADLLLSATGADEASVTSSVQSKIESTNKVALMVKKLLTKLGEETETLKSRGELSGAQLRMRETMVSTAMRKFQSVLTDYRASQDKFKTDVKGKFTRQLKIAQPDLTDEAVDELLRSGKSAGELIKASVLKGDADARVTSVLESAQSQYSEVLALEKSMVELHQIFSDMSLLVTQQGELLDVIENQVKIAGQHVDEGNQQLREGIEIQKSIRKKQFYICLALLILIAIVIGVIYGVHENNKN